MRWRFSLILFLFLLSVPAGAQVPFAQSIRLQEQIQTGREAYLKRCAGCHGVTGDGQGPAAQMLHPKPRNFQSGVFKLKSAELGAMPSDADLMRILNQGIPGTSMPSFRLVSEDEKRAIIEYIKTFAPEAWANRDPGKDIPPLPMPEGVFTNKDPFLDYARVGRVWFQELGCVTCHGNEGRGDGMAAATLTDMWGEPIEPANLRRPYAKRGYGVEDVAYSIYQGVDGSPMPAHGTVLQHLDDRFPEIAAKRFIWELTAYILYLRGEEAGLYTKDTIPPIPQDRIPPDEVKKVVGEYFAPPEDNS